jgi:hypothetical protein
MKADDDEDIIWEAVSKEIDIQIVFGRGERKLFWHIETLTRDKCDIVVDVGAAVIEEMDKIFNAKA